MECSERDRLLEQRQQAAVALGEIIEQLPAASAAAFGSVSISGKAALQILQAAREKYEAHVREHGCGER